MRHSSEFTAGRNVLHKIPNASEERSDFTAMTWLRISVQLIERCIQLSLKNAAMDLGGDNTLQQTSQQHLNQSSQC